MSLRKDVSKLFNVLITPDQTWVQYLETLDVEGRLDTKSIYKLLSVILARLEKAENT